MIFNVAWQEDGSATVLARVTGGTNATGSATGVAGEGKWLKQADLTAITYSAFDESSTTPDTAIASGTLTIASVINDTPQNANTYWTKDTVGYNFIYTFAAATFPTGDHQYKLEIKFTNGTVTDWLELRGIARAIRTS